jgi:peptidoglycan/xylan/chitin deacetylase (PgdA/CDA1 family)
LSDTKIPGPKRPFKWRSVIIITVAVLVAAGAALYGTWQLARSRDFQLFGKLVSHVEASEKVVALTFDDGPTHEYAPGVLAVLKEKGVKATFFVIGQDAEKNMDELRAIIAAGHEVGNHTFTHPDMTFASEARSADEIERTDAIIREAGYTAPILFRAPYTKKLIGLPLYLSKHDRTIITCNVEPDSFEDVAADPARITAHVLEQAKPGSIILLHVMYKSRETSRQALPGVIDGLRAQGYSFLTVSELIAKGGG